MSSRLVVSSVDSAKWDQITRVTWPSMKMYADLVGAKFAGLHGECQTRPASWQKLVAIAWGLASHEEVLWLDADVDTRLASEDIFDAIPNGEHVGMCFLTDEHGVGHFNCGVMLCRRSFLPMLVEAAMCDQFARHQWWEQAAINWLASTGSARPYRLDEKWNVWRGSQASDRQFLHACGISGIENKLEWLRSA